MSLVAKISALYLISIIAFTEFYTGNSVLWDCFYHIYEATFIIFCCFYLMNHIKTSYETPLILGVMIYKSIIVIIQLISVYLFARLNKYDDYREFMSNQSLVLILTLGFLGLMLGFEYIVKRVK